MIQFLIMKTADSLTSDQGVPAEGLGEHKVA